MTAWRWIDRLTDAVIMLAPIGRRAAEAIRARRARRRGRDPLAKPLESPAEVARKRRES